MHRFFCQLIGHHKLFSKAFKKLFNIRERVVIEKPTSFSGSMEQLQANHVEPAAAQVKSAETAPVVAVDLSALFYSLLFPSTQLNGTANELEKSVFRRVEAALAAPKAIAERVLKMPTQVAALDKQLADENTDTKALLALIEKDPVLSVEVLKLCNSPLFRRSDKDVTSLQLALVQLGRDQIRRFVTTAMMRKIIDVKPIYFRRFGSQIWRHSMQVAYLASQLADEDPDSAFLLGLVHDVGKIAIFKLLLEAFKQAEPGEQPCSSLFRQVMTTKSLSLSALLAHYWQLPSLFESELNRLAVVDSKPTGGLAEVIWRANLISECSMLFEAGKLQAEQLNRLLYDAGVDRTTFDEIHKKLVLF
ncbi:HDOD domain-containing protein [Shewanella sp. 1CM18E]|uniref:HDOD domain-containing protein n=1 Tax=Shewanella sp. 1CM18E TaxID=2929169 RepID=UPI0020C15494|nr:HDOD domain-containing protein [Shewanella sp. 1CM18E]MCK8046846.1 HDOD domain-containing protein [Shewanella sp. 1CM18E]